MRVIRDKQTGKYKLGPNCQESFDTKEQAQRHGLDKLAENLAYIRRKINEGVLGYGK